MLKRIFKICDNILTELVVVLKNYAAYIVIRLYSYTEVRPVGQDLKINCPTRRTFSPKTPILLLKRQNHILIRTSILQEDVYDSYALKGPYESS